MAHRTFDDNAGRTWEVWSVTPVKVERRNSGAHKAVLEFDDRRKKSEYRVRLGRAMVNGWLCFETADEKRRLAPFPPAWDSLSDDELRQLCVAGTAVTQTRRGARLRRPKA